MTKEEILFYAQMLPEPLQQVLHLHNEENLTQKEIAERMKISMYRVRGYLSKGMYLIRKEAGDKELDRAGDILRSANKEEPI